MDQQSLAKGSIQTVLGPISPDQLGTTLCHEHLFHKIDGSVFNPKPLPSIHSHLSKARVEPGKLWYTNYHPYTQQDNLDFATPPIQDILVEELKFYKQNGGQSIVELTTFGKNDQVLVDMAQASGVNVITNTGFYVAPAFDTCTLNRGVEQLYEQMRNELLIGVNNIKAGVVGELGSNWPIHPFEKNVLLAAGQLQSELDVPVILHPGRDPRAPAEILRIITEAGGNASRIVMSHLDRTLNDEQLVEFARQGCICELDLFGNETSYYEPANDFDMPSDGARIRQVKLLIQEGFAKSVAISHDIHTKHRLMHFGGHGYSHILMNVVPKMIQRGISKEEIDQILVATPRRWLTL